MDAQTQEKLSRIEHQFEINKNYSGYLLLNSEEAGFLLKLVREQEDERNMYKQQMEYWRASSDQLTEKCRELRDRLTKYERVVEAAKRLIEKARKVKANTGDNGQPDWYEYSSSDFDSLMDAVDALDEFTNIESKNHHCKTLSGDEPTLEEREKSI